MKAYTKDIIQTINKGKKRFFAIMFITALGVCMLSALKAACEDLRYTADLFFDEQNLYDISVVSTLGLTDEDVKVLSSIGGIAQVEGTYSETVYTENDGQTKQALVKILSNIGMNEPYLLEGRMPEEATEILVTQKYISESGKSIGDIIEIEEKIEISEDDETEEEPNFLYNQYEIVGIVVDVTDINSNEGAVSFRSNSTTDYTFFVMPKAAQSKVYTAVYITLDNTKELSCYTTEYETAVEEIVNYLEEYIKEDREEARYVEIQKEAMEEIADAEEEVEEQLSDAEDEINDAKEQLKNGQQEINSGLADIQKTKEEIAAKWEEIINGKELIASGKAEIATKEAELLQQEASAREE